MIFVASERCNNFEWVITVHVWFHRSEIQVKKRVVLQNLRKKKKEKEKLLKKCPEGREENFVSAKQKRWVEKRKWWKQRLLKPNRMNRTQ